MPDLTPNLLRLVAERPDFLAAVESSLISRRSPRSRPVLRLTLDHFLDDPIHLYACLSFARQSGVEVRFLASLTPQ